jgi:DNA-directed RNA polymerase subunit RPC12/RpoP
MSAIRYDMGKLCGLCGRPVDNRTRVLTCQKCRHQQYLARKQVKEPR